MLFLLITTLSLFIYQTYFVSVHPLTISTDASMYLDMGALILEGKIPYRDFAEFNFPLIMYLSTLPVLLSRIWAIPLPQIFNYLVIICEIASVLLSLRLCHKAEFKHKGKRGELIALVLSAALFNQAVGPELGQREHLFCIFFLPCIVSRICNNARAQLPISLIAGLALALKPQFLIIFLAFEATRLHKSEINNNNIINNNSRPPLYALAAMTFIFSLLLFLPLDALKTLFLEALPVYAGGIEWGGNSFIYRLAAPGFMHTTLLVLSSLLLALPHYRRSGLCADMATLVLASLALYIAGAQAWTYRYLPAAFFATMLTGQCLYLYVRSWLPRLIIRETALCAGLFTLIILLSLGRITFDNNTLAKSQTVEINGCQSQFRVPQSDLSTTALTMLKLGKPGERAIYIGTGCYPGYPSQLQAGLRPGSRYLFSMLAQVQTCIDKGRLDKDKSVPYFESIKAKMIENYEEDIASTKPSLIFIQDWPMESLLGTDFQHKNLTAYNVIGKLENCTIWGRTGK
jgi:hypothetical protein